jgi:hypothetical protein
VKPTYLKDRGHDVINPALDDDDFDAAVRTAQQAFDRIRPDVVVGSSRGGAVAMNIDSGDAGLVLLCPAWKNWGSAKAVKASTVIVHSRADDVIPFAHSEELATSSGAMLIEAGDDHRLADPEPLSVMLWACEVLGAGELPPPLSDDVVSESPAANSQKEASYLCDACGEEIVIPLDLTEGMHQTYVEDCPVCCRANTIHVEVDDEGNTTVRAEPEQDRE